MMQKIGRLLGNLFADTERSIEDLTAAFLAHNTLFQPAPDPGTVLGPNKARTAALATQLTALTTAVGSGQATQQAGRTLSEAERTAALARLTSNEAALRSDYVVTDEKLRARLLQLLFPGGLSAFSQAPLKSLPDLLRVFLDLVQDPENQVPAVVVTKSVEDLTPFASARTAQLVQQQATEKARTDRRALLSALEEQLTRNLHALCFAYEDDRAAAASYFPARYFEDAAPSRPGRHDGTVAPAHTNQVLDLGAAAARFTHLRLRLTQGTALAIFRTTDARQPYAGPVREVRPDAPLLLPLAQLPGTGPWLVARNAGPNTGHYVAELLTPEEAAGEA